TTFYVALTFSYLGDYRRAIALVRSAVRGLVGEWIHWGTPGISSVLARAFLGWYLALLGEFPEAIEQGEGSIRIAEEAGQPYSRISAHVVTGEIYLNRGDLPHAIARLGHGLQLVRDWNLPGYRLWVTT